MTASAKLSADIAGMNDAFSVSDPEGIAFLRECPQAFLQDDKKWTFDHCQRVGDMAREFAIHLGVSSGAAANLGLATVCHDVGKLCISNDILNHTGPLTTAERAIINSHAGLGGLDLREGGTPLCNLAAEVAENHHERWDGKGYPENRKGDAIPLSARIASLCDVFDAIHSQRPYQPAHSIGKTLDIMTDPRGGLAGAFEPELLEAFVRFQLMRAENEITELERETLRQRINPHPASPHGAPVNPSPRGIRP